MPIYEYCCKNCGHQLEEIQKVSDAPLVICPECGKPNLEKMVSHTSFQLKGAGWYVTDFKNADKKPAEKKKDEATGSTEEKKQEASKPAMEKSEKKGGE